MDERLAFAHPRGDWRASGCGIAFSERGIGRWNPAGGDGAGSLAVDDGHEAEGRSAEPHRPFEHRVEHRGKVTRRRIDDLQYLGGRGLLLQCVAEIAVARLQLIEQTDVLEGDGGLVGEGFEERYLDRGEGLDCTASAADDTDRSTVLEDWYREE